MPVGNMSVNELIADFTAKLAVAEQVAEKAKIEAEEIRTNLNNLQRLIGTYVEASNGVTVRAVHQTPVTPQPGDPIAPSKFRAIDGLLAANPQGLTHAQLKTMMADKGYVVPKSGFGLSGAIKSERVIRVGLLYFSGPKVPK